MGIHDLIGHRARRIFRRRPDDIDRLRGAALACRDTEPPSVRDKSALAPSGNPQDYFHPAPYWWPTSSNEADFIYRDGQRRPGTEGDGSAATLAYDRWPLQRLFDETYILALAGYLLKDSSFTAAAVRRVEVWFLDANTAMTPHLTFAQHIATSNGKKPRDAGIIEFANVYYFLDGLRLLDVNGSLPSASREGVRNWFAAYVRYLTEDPSARAEFVRKNNRGTWADAQLLAIETWRGSRVLLGDQIERITARLDSQFDPDGAQPEELSRTRPLHYATYNLQAWSVCRDLLVWSNNELLAERIDNRIRIACAWLRTDLGTMISREPEFDIARLRLLERLPIPIDYEFERTSGVRPFFGLSGPLFLK